MVTVFVPVPVLMFTAWVPAAALPPPMVTVVVPFVFVPDSISTC